MSLQQNQFNMIPVQGQQDLNWGGSVFSMAVDTNQATALVAGQAVKLYASTGPLPTVVGLAANTDPSFGFVLRNLKDANFPALARVEIASNFAVLYMTAGAAITRGAKLEVVYTTNKVITNAGTNPVIGIALDPASADGDLIRVMIINSFTSAQVIADIAGLQDALTNAINSGAKVCTARVDRATSTALTTITGCSVALLAGATYIFDAHISGVSTANGGAKAAIAGDGTLSATSFTCTGQNFNTTTANAASTTTTLGTAVGAATAVFSDIYLTGAIVVNAAGVLNLQIAQNASHADTTSAYVNSTLKVTRVA